MNPGKISNSILNRSVLKLIKSKNKRVQKPAIGIDCGVIDLEDNDKCILCSEACGIFPVYRVANNIYACGGIPLAAHTSVIMPRNFNEYNLKEEIRSLNQQCSELDMQISGGHTQINDMIKAPVVTVTGIGVSQQEQPITAKNMKAGQYIVMSKWIGIGGIRAIIDNKKEEILQRYVEDVVDKAYGDILDMTVKAEAIKAIECNVTAMHDVAEGGIFGALWDMAEAANTGLEIDFRKIPVKQEIIEICEMFDVNPYKLESSGALLMATDDGDRLVKELAQIGVPATIIGRATDCNDRILNNQDEKRYLDTPQRDEVYRFLGGLKSERENS